MGFIRWKFVIPLFVLIGLIIGFFVLFFDALLERALERAGGKLNGARVDITGLETKLFKGRLTIQDVQIANPDVEMKNTLQSGPLAFELDIRQMLKKRIFIPEARVDGIQFNTDRTVSGKIRRAAKKKKKDGKPGIASKLTQKYQSRFKVTLDNVKVDAKKKVEFDPKETAIVKRSNEIKTKSKELPDQWKNRIDQLDVDGRLKNVEKDLTSIKETPTKGTEALLAIPKALDKLSRSKKELDQIKTDIKQTKTDLVKEISTLKSDVKSLEKAKQTDLDDLASRLNLDFADPKRLVEGIIGPVVLERTQKILHYVEIIRNNLPSKKEKESVPQRARSGGMDILFPRPQDPPRLWLQNASLSGQFEEITAAGSLTHLNSDPPRVGKPTALQLKGQKGPHKFGLLISIDHTTDVKKDGFSFMAQDLQLTKLVSNGSFAKAMSEGWADANFAVNVIGENGLGGHVNFDLWGLKFDQNRLLGELNLPTGENLKSEDQIKVSFATNLVKALEKMTKINIKGKISGTWEDPSITLKSNLDNVFKEVVKETVGNVVRDQKKRLEAELNNLLNTERAELNAKINEFQNKYLKELGLQNNQVQSLIKDATGIDLKADTGVPAEIPNLDAIKDLFK